MNLNARGSFSFYLPLCPLLLLMMLAADDARC
jgi:hypothetical protein